MRMGDEEERQRERERVTSIMHDCVCFIITMWCLSIKRTESDSLHIEMIQS